MAIQHLQQKRLIFAKKETEETSRDAKDAPRSSNYDSMVKKIPTYILTNGLLYTLAYLEEKDREVFYDIWNWHCQSEWNERKMLPDVSKRSFLAELLKKTDSEIRLLTLETLALMKCMRRFVKDDS